MNNSPKDYLTDRKPTREIEDWEKKFDEFWEIVRLILCFAYGAFISYLGYSFKTWQYWVLVALFFSYGLLQGL